MTPAVLRELLDGVRCGTVAIDDAVKRLETLPFEDLGFAKLDHHRHLRCGFPEVVFCVGKTVEQVSRIFTQLAARGNAVLATRATAEMFAAVEAALPGTVRFNASARCIVHHPHPVASSAHPVVVVSAGTADLPVAEEAVETARIMDRIVHTCYDVGVAGLHRLLGHLELLRRASAIVVVAGMEGALASVVGGLVDKPVIAVPTSVGYGAHFGGLAPLLGMLNSCASNVAVVNIDNGFGGGFYAATISRQIDGATEGCGAAS